MRLRFAEFTFDEGRRLLFRGPEPVDLSPRAFQLLGLLLKRRPEAVPKAELLSALWPDTFVTEGNLASLVKEIRHALGETGRESPTIRTAHGFGYAFEAEVIQPADEPVATHGHRLLWGRQEIHLLEGRNLVGRKPEATVWIGHASVSREHACIRITGATAHIEDLDSKNGTFRNGQRIVSAERLSDRDQIRIGRIRLTYRCGPDDFTAETETDASTSPRA